MNSRQMSLRTVRQMHLLKRNNMLEIYVAAIDSIIKVDEDGRFELPARPYTTAELKKIAVQINREIRKLNLEQQEEW